MALQSNNEEMSVEQKLAVLEDEIGNFSYQFFELSRINIEVIYSFNVFLFFIFYYLLLFIIYVF
jgi:hypothetical protein